MDSFVVESHSPSVTRMPTAPPKKEIWSALLQSVGSGKRLAEKQLLVLGGTPDTQRDFIASIDTEPSKSTSRTLSSSKAPIANDFALGYTYRDVLDTDHGDILARLSVYTLSKSSPRFLPLLRPLFTPSSIPNMLLVILLDWSEPWNWIQQLQAWIRLLHTLLQSLPTEAVHALQDNITEWRDRKRNASNAAPSSVGDSTSTLDPDVSLPLGPGEWDLPLGVPLCVVCQKSNLIETLEKEAGWKDRHFDFIQQYLRTVILKHGGSLIYTMPHLSGVSGALTTLQTLIHQSLEITNLIQSSQAQRIAMATSPRYNTTDRDHILVPPNFDSWGKIRILTDDFDVQGVSEAWAADIESQGSYKVDIDDGESKAVGSASRSESSAVLRYGNVIKAPEEDNAAIVLPGNNKSQSGLEVESKDTQIFLAEQSTVLDELAKEDEHSAVLRDSRKNLGPLGSGEVEDHIGPVQFNLGGIQMDAEDAVKRLKDREATRAAAETEIGETTGSDREKMSKSSENDEAENAKLASFFTSLIKKPGDRSATNSPRRARENLHL